MLSHIQLMLNCNSSRCYQDTIKSLRQTAFLWPALGRTPASSPRVSFVCLEGAAHLQLSLPFLLTLFNLVRGIAVSLPCKTFAEEKCLTFAIDEIAAHHACLRYASSLLCKGLNSALPFAWIAWFSPDSGELSRIHKGCQNLALALCSWLSERHHVSFSSLAMGFVLGACRREM